MLEIRFQADYSKGYDQMAFVRECLKVVFHHSDKQTWHLITEQGQYRPIVGTELEKALLQAAFLTRFQLIYLTDDGIEGDIGNKTSLMARLEVQNGEHFLLQTRLPFFPNALHFLQNNTHKLSIETRR